MQDYKIQRYRNNTKNLLWNRTWILKGILYRRGEEKCDKVREQSSTATISKLKIIALLKYGTVCGDRRHPSKMRRNERDKVRERSSTSTTTKWNSFVEIWYSLRWNRGHLTEGTLHIKSTFSWSTDGLGRVQLVWDIGRDPPHCCQLKMVAVDKLESALIISSTNFSPKESFKAVYWILPFSRSWFTTARADSRDHLNFSDSELGTTNSFHLTSAILTMVVRSGRTPRK